MDSLPVQLAPIPPLVINEGVAFRSVNLKSFFRSPDGDALHFTLQLTDGKPLPKGLALTPEGVLSGTGKAGTLGEYDITVTVTTGAKQSLVVPFHLSIQEGMPVENPNFLTQFKSIVWEALEQNLPLPEIGNILERPITPIEMYYLLQRFAMLTIWDVYNLETPGAKVLLDLPGNSPHYNIYDRGSCLVAAPKNLFSHERTLGDALKAAEAMAGEVYSRGWTIEFAGFNKMVRAAWVELQHLSDIHGKKLEILHYTPTPDDLRVYVIQNQMRPPAPG